MGEDTCCVANVILTVKIGRLYVTAHLFTVCKNKWHLLLEPILSSMLGLINGFQETIQLLLLFLICKCDCAPQLTSVNCVCCGQFDIMGGEIWNTENSTFSYVTFFK